MMLGDMIGGAMAGEAKDAAGFEDPGLADDDGDMGGFDDFGGGDFGEF